jgi:hypothetical protein
MKVYLTQFVSALLIWGGGGGGGWFFLINKN